MNVVYNESNVSREYEKIKKLLADFRDAAEVYYKGKSPKDLGYGRAKEMYDEIIFTGYQHKHAVERYWEKYDPLSRNLDNFDAYREQAARDEDYESAAEWRDTKQAYLRFGEVVKGDHSSEEAKLYKRCLNLTYNK